MRAHLPFITLSIGVLSCAAPREVRVDSPAADTSARPQPANTPWDLARERGIDFRAIGQEPGWMLEIDNGKQIAMLADYGEKKVTTPAPTPRDSAGTTIYDVTTEAHRLTISSRREVCHDSMSGEEMTHTVTVVLDGKEYRGCGREIGGRG